MKVIVAGSRGIQDEKWIANKLWDLCLDVPYEHEAFCYMEELVCGMATGPDLIAKNWAEKVWQQGKNKEFKILIKEFPADWEKYGKAAGAIRNKEMGDYADALIAFWDGKSRGTKHMIDYMLSIGKEVHVYVYKAS